MKKIISIFFISIFTISSFGGLSYACTQDSECTPIGITFCELPKPPLVGEGVCKNSATGQPENHGCTSTQTRYSPTNQCIENQNQGTSPDTTVNGITIGETCLINGQCKFNIYETLGIRKSTGGETSVGLFVQDIVLSATFFIGTVVTVAIIVSGLMYIFAAASGKDPTNAKKGLIGALIGLAIVASSYFIIRLVQYLAKGV